MERKDRIQAIMPCRVTERRIFILLMVWPGPVSMGDVKDAVRGLTDSEYYSKLHRMIHRAERYKQLRDLAEFGVLHHYRRGNRAYFRLERSMRRKLARVVGDIMPSRRRG